MHSRTVIFVRVFSSSSISVPIDPFLSRSVPGLGYTPGTRPCTDPPVTPTLRPLSFLSVSFTSFPPLSPSPVPEIPKDEPQIKKVNVSIVFVKGMTM